MANCDFQGSTFYFTDHIHSFFNKNILHTNIEAEICEILKPRHMDNVTQYRSKYETLVIDTPINSKTEMS